MIKKSEQKTIEKALHRFKELVNFLGCKKDKQLADLACLSWKKLIIFKGEKCKSYVVGSGKCKIKVPFRYNDYCEEDDCPLITRGNHD